MVLRKVAVLLRQARLEPLHLRGIQRIEQFPRLDGRGAQCLAQQHLECVVAPLQVGKRQAPRQPVTQPVGKDDVLRQLGLAVPRHKLLHATLEVGLLLGFEAEIPAAAPVDERIRVVVAELQRRAAGKHSKPRYYDDPPGHGAPRESHQ